MIAQSSDPTTEQKRLVYHLLLTLLVAGIVSNLLHKPSLLFTLVALSWLISIFSLGRDGYLAITRMVVAMGVVMYFLVRFAIPDWPA